MKDLLVAQLAPPPVRPFSPLPDLEGLRGNAVSVGKYDTGLWEYHFNGNSCIVPKTQFVQRFEDHFFESCGKATFTAEKPGCLCENLKEGITSYHIFHGKLFGINFDLSSYGTSSYSTILYLFLVFAILYFPLYAFINNYRMRRLVDSFGDPDYLFKWKKYSNSYSLALISIVFGSFLVYSNIQSKTTISIFGQSLETSVPGLGLIFLGFIAWFLVGGGERFKIRNNPPPATQPPQPPATSDGAPEAP